MPHAWAAVHSLRQLGLSVFSDTSELMRYVVHKYFFWIDLNTPTYLWGDNSSWPRQKGDRPYDIPLGTWMLYYPCHTVTLMPWDEGFNRIMVRYCSLWLRNHAFIKSVYSKQPILGVLLGVRMCRGVALELETIDLQVGMKFVREKWLLIN